MRIENSGRLPTLTPGDLSPEQRLVYDEITGGRRAQSQHLLRLDNEDGSLAGPFNAMLIAPAVGMHLQRLGSALRYQTSLPPAARELAILLCARAERSEFEWYAHKPIALAAGVSPAILRAILADEPLPLTDAVERAVGTAVSALLSAGDFSDEDHAALTTVLSTAQIVELVVLVGYYRLLSGVLRVFRVPLPPDAQPVFVTAGA